MRDTKQSRWRAKQVVEFKCYFCGASVTKNGRNAENFKHSLRYRGYAFCNRQCAGAARRKANSDSIMGRVSANV